MSAACRKGSARSCARIGGLGSATSHPAASCRPAESTAPSPALTPTPGPLPPADAGRAPDALGLSRMMRQCGWLEAELSEYEASRDASVHGDDKGDDQGDATTTAEPRAPVS